MDVKKIAGRVTRSNYLKMGCIALCGVSLAFGASAGVAQGPASASSSSNGVGSPFELAFWQSIATSDDRTQYEAYLTQYPAGTFSGLARAKIAAIDRARGIAPAAVAPPPGAAIPAPAAAQPPAPIAPTAAAVAPVPVPIPVPASVPTPEPTSVAVPIAAPVQTAVAPTVAAPASDPYAKIRAAMAARAAAAAGAAQPGAAPVPAVAPSLSQPVLAAIPSVDVPAKFCSAEDRNRFHDTVYKPAVAIADQNNQAAIAYLDKLQAAHDAHSGRREIEAANLVAKEASAYKPIAQDTYAKRSAFTPLFDRIMAVPIVPCS